MHWLRSIDETAAGYPAIWLVETPDRPRNLMERSRLRRETARAVLSRQLRLPGTDLAIAHDPAGRPLLATAAATGLHLSLATRAGVVAVAVARSSIGVDVEQVDPGGLVPREALHAEELRRLDALSPSQRPLAFARLWAAKEAYVKALGTGFARAPDSFAITLIAAERFRVADPQRGGSAEGLLRTIENGGRETLAAAAIVLDGA